LSLRVPICPHVSLWEKIGTQGIKFLANNHSKLSIILPRYSYKNTHKVHKFAKLHKVATRHWNTYRRKSHTRTQFDTVYHAIRHCHTVQHFPLLVIATQWNTYRRNTRYTHARTYARTHALLLLHHSSLIHCNTFRCHTFRRHTFRRNTSFTDRRKTCRQSETCRADIIHGPSYCNTQVQHKIFYYSQNPIKILSAKTGYYSSIAEILFAIKAKPQNRQHCQGNFYN